MERIVVAEARRAAAIFECSIVDAISAAHDQLGVDLIGESEARREVILLDDAQAGAVGVGVDEVMPSLASRLVKLDESAGLSLRLAGMMYCAPLNGVPGNEIRLRVILLAGGAEPIPTHSQIQSEFADVTFQSSWK